VLAYLSRYTHRVAISNRRLIAFDESGVTFRYKDYRRDGAERQRVMTIAADEFIRRFLLHVLPRGFHRIRHYGLLAGSAHNPSRDTHAAGNHGAYPRRRSRRHGPAKTCIGVSSQWQHDADHRTAADTTTRADPSSSASETATKSEIPIAQRLPLRGSYTSGFSTPDGARNPSTKPTFSA
jgi:hypothetical protein